MGFDGWWMTVFPMLGGILIAVWLISSTATRRGRAERVRSESSKWGIEVPPDLEDELGRGAAVRARTLAIGVVLGFTVGSVVFLFVRPASAPIALWVGIASVLTIVGFSAALGAARRPTVVGGPRIARARSLTLADYLSPWELVPARVLPIAGLIAAVVVALTTATPLAWLAAGLGALALVAAVVFELVGRRLVALGQPAREPLELAWDDGIRADALRSMASAASAAGALALVGSVIALASDLAPTSAVDTVTTSIVVGMAVCVSVLSGLASRLDLRRYYLRHLWPDVPRVPREGL